MKIQKQQYWCCEMHIHILHTQMHTSIFSFFHILCLADLSFFHANECTIIFFTPLLWAAYNQRFKKIIKKIVLGRKEYKLL